MSPLTTTPAPAGHRRWLPYLIALLLTPACSRDLPLDVAGDRPGAVPATQTGAGPRMLASGGFALDTGTMDRSLIELTRLVALALNDPGVRARVSSALHASPFREHKLHFRPLLDAGGNDLLYRMGVAGNTDAPAIRALLDSTVDLEFYMPVPEHLKAWQGEADLMVVTSLHDGNRPVGFDLAGRRVPGLSADHPPATPALVLVPRELEFTRPDALARATCVPSEEYDCGGGSGGGASGGSGGGGSGNGSWPGIYMTYSHLENLHEDWTRGSPELEIYLLQPVDSTAWAYQPVLGNAGEHVSYPAYYDQNDHSWSGNVRLASDYQLDQLQYRYPAGTPASQRPFALAVWEDDNTANVIKDPDHNYSSAVFGTALVVPAAQLALQYGTNPSSIAAMLAVAGLTILVESAHQLFDLKDDFVGLIVDASEWTRYSNIAIPQTHVVMDGTYKVGEVTLVYRP